MDLIDARFFMGGFGKILYSDELARTKRGILWKDRNGIVVGCKKTFNWETISAKKLFNMMKKANIEFSEEEIKSINIMLQKKSKSKENQSKQVE